jgi:hypothetical protein
MTCARVVAVRDERNAAICACDCGVGFMMGTGIGRRMNGGAIGGATFEFCVLTAMNKRVGVRWRAFARSVAVFVAFQSRARRCATDEAESSESA